MHEQQNQPLMRVDTEEDNNMLERDIVLSLVSYTFNIPNASRGVTGHVVLFPNFKAADSTTPYYDIILAL